MRDIFLVRIGNMKRRMKPALCVMTIDSIDPFRSSAVALPFLLPDRMCPERNVVRLEGNAISKQSEAMRSLLDEHAVCDHIRRQPGCRPVGKCQGTDHDGKCRQERGSSHGSRQQQRDVRKE